jgi:hypothetical protein
LLFAVVSVVIRLSAGVPALLAGWFGACFVLEERDALGAGVGVENAGES